MQEFLGPGRMRIRKTQHRNTANTTVRAPPENVPPLLKLGWDGDGFTNGAGVGGPLIKATVTEQSGLDSVTTSASPGVSMLQRGHVVEEPARSTEPGMKSDPDMAMRPCPDGSTNEDVHDIVDHGADPEGSTVSVDQLWQGPDGDDHVTRHYVRRSNKGGDGLSRALFDSSIGAAAARPSISKSNGNDEIKQTCKSEDFPSVHVKTEMPSSDKGALKSNLPLEADQESSETESEDEAIHPSTAPEGSLLHTLYLQLLAAGSEGITLRELFASFKKQTALPSLGSDWKEQVRAHLKNNPHFDEVKRHFLLCEQLVQPKRSSGRSSGSLKRPYLGVSPRTTTSGHHLPSLRTTTIQSTLSAAAQPSTLPPRKHEGVQTRRKAYEKTIEAVLTESAMEFQKMQQSLGNLQVTAASDTKVDSTFVKADSLDTLANQTPLPTSRKRKSSSDNEELGMFSKTIRGSLQAMQARILAETGVQKGVPCSRKDDARKWRCPLMAMEGHTLCEHHKTLQLRKRMKKQEENKISRRLASTDKEDIVVGLGGVHAVEALMDLQGREREEQYFRVVQPRRISFHNTVDEAEAMEEDVAPNQVEEEGSEILMNYSSKTGDTTTTTTTTTTPTLDGSSRKSPTSSDGEPDEVHKDVHYERAIPGSLKALQAKILAESGEQSGVRCARKDGSNDSARKWQCPLDALPGHTLCQHHNFLKERKRARYAAAKKKKDEVRMVGGQRRGPDTTTTASNDDMGLPARTTEFDALPPRSDGHKSSEKEEESHGEELVRKPRLKDGTRNLVADGIRDHDDSTDTEDEHILEPAKRISIVKSKEPKDLDNDNSNNGSAEKLLTQVFKNAPKRRYVAAKKTAASVDVVKEKSLDRETSPLIRPPTIPPLPAMYGVRRKAVKNRSLLSL